MRARGLDLLFRHHKKPKSRSSRTHSGITTATAMMPTWLAELPELADPASGEVAGKEGDERDTVVTELVVVES